MTISDYKLEFKDALFASAVTVALFVLLLLLSGCERRELYVYGDEFHSVELEVDWRDYADRDPDGMTVWFFPLSGERTEPYRSTTASVRHQDVYLPGGYYQGVVVDYSPEEYSRQAFVGMNRLDSARVELTPSSYQPDSLTVAGEGVPKGLSYGINEQLFGEPAWNSLQTARPAINASSGLYIVSNQPEQMGLDTLDHKYVDAGLYGDYVPWQERNTYQDDIIISRFYAAPRSIIWKLRIRIWIRSGFNYLWQTPASISGLADGHFLPADMNTDRRCLMAIDGWEMERTGENSGYIQTSLLTFGLCPSGILPDRRLNGARSAGEIGWYDYYTNVCRPEELRLNVSFTLRDRATTLTYHFDVGDQVVSFDEQLVLRVELGPDFFGPGGPGGGGGVTPIDLPYVDAYNGTGFGAEVDPWEEEPPIDIDF